MADIRLGPPVLDAIATGAAGLDMAVVSLELFGGQLTVLAGAVTDPAERTVTQDPGSTVHQCVGDASKDERREAPGVATDGGDQARQKIVDDEDGRPNAYATLADALRQAETLAGSTKPLF